MTATLRTTALISIYVLISIKAFSQHAFKLKVLLPDGKPAEAATVKLKDATTVLQTVVSNTNGLAAFNNVKAGTYSFAVSYTGYQPVVTRTYAVPAVTSDSIVLQQVNTSLAEVSIVTRNPPVQ